MIPRYDYPQIRAIWENPNKYLIWMRIETLFLNAFRGINIPIPCEFKPEWIAEIEQIEQKTKHDVAAFVQWLEKYLAQSIGNESRFVHFGLTSSDILDTTFSIMIKETDVVISDLVDNFIVILEDMIRKYGKIDFLGRTHGQAAEKISFAHKFGAYKMLSFWKPRMNYYGRLSGSIGDHKYFDAKIERSVITDLGLEISPANDGQIIHRSVYAACMNDWAILASSIAKIATDIRLLSHNGIEEIQEGFSEGQIGSSSMPQKRNPILSENLCGLARVIRGHQVTAMQNIELWNERDISHSSAERIIFPEAATLLGFMLNRLIEIFAHLCVNETNITENVKCLENNGQITAQSRMLELINAGMSRTMAHETVKQECFRFC